MGPEDNPADDVQPTKEKWEEYERSRPTDPAGEAAYRVRVLMRGPASCYYDGGRLIMDEEIIAALTLARAWRAEHAGEAAAADRTAVTCRGCGKPLIGDDRTADGCPCNSPRGVNHGLVPSYVCTCPECDPQQTGSTRPAPTVMVSATGPVDQAAMADVIGPARVAAVRRDAERGNDKYSEGVVALRADLAALRTTAADLVILVTALSEDKFFRENFRIITQWLDSFLARPAVAALLGGVISDRQPVTPPTEE